MYNFPPNFYSDVRIEHVYTSYIRSRQGKIEEIKETSYSGAYIRLFDGDLWYCSSTVDLDSINKELEHLACLAKPNPDINNHPIIKQMQVCKDDHKIFSDFPVNKIDIEEKKHLLESYDALTSENALVTSKRASYEDILKIKRFVSSLGSDITQDFQDSGVYISFTFGKGPNSFSESWNHSEINFLDLNGHYDQCRQMIAQSEDFYKRAGTVPGGKYTVILSPMAAGIFAHESFGHGSEADDMLGDEKAVKSWEIGKRVGSEFLTIVDDGNEIGSGYTPYDDEGTKAQKTLIINKGILSGRLHNAETSVFMNENLTGNSRALDFQNSPLVRMTCTYIESGNQTKEELFSSIDHGIYIDTVKSGSGSNIFTMAPSLAYLIEKGKITKPVKISVITGNVMETLGLIDGLSNKKQLFSFVGGGCGKRGQFPLPVGFGGPFVRIKEINIQ